MKLARTLEWLCVGLVGLGLTLGCGGKKGPSSKSSKTKKKQTKAPATAKTPDSSTASPADKMAAAVEQMKAQMAPILEIFKKPVSSADVQKLLKILPTVRKEGGENLIQPTPAMGETFRSKDEVTRKVEAKPTFMAVIGKQGMTAGEFVEKSTVALQAAEILKDGGVEAIEAQIAKQEKVLAAESSAEQPPPMAMAQGMMLGAKVMLEIAKAIPQATYDAVKPYQDALLTTGKDQ